MRQAKWEEEREREGEGGSLEGRETKPVQVNNLTKHVIGLAESERESGLSLAADTFFTFMSRSFTLLTLLHALLTAYCRRSRDDGVALGEVTLGHRWDYILHYSGSGRVCMRK